MNASPAISASRKDHPFGLIVCGVDGSPSALEAVRQAGALAGPNTTIELVAVTDERGGGQTGGTVLSKRFAQEALEQATAELAHGPARVTSRTVNGHPAATKLLEEAADADLLVVARHGYSRIGGILVGSTATKVLHKAEVPVLVTMPPPAGQTFPGRVVVAADGPGHPEDAVRLGTALAEHHGADVSLLRVDWSRRHKRPEIADAVAGLQERTGVTPVESLLGGAAHRVIPEYAGREHASLVITGSRHLTGVHALRSVSERVAHESPCSVLVLGGSRR
jgi:nucleotide-binding universal stress UspA family protein